MFGSNFPDFKEHCKRICQCSIEIKDYELVFQQTASWLLFDMMQGRLFDGGNVDYFITSPSRLQIGIVSRQWGSRVQ